MAANSEQQPGGSMVDSSGGSESESRRREMWKLIDDLEAESQNPQVERLITVLELMQRELGRLEARNRKLEDRLSRVEAVNGITGEEIDLSDVNELDHRDEKVVEAIVADGLETVTLSDLQRLYRNRTDVRAKETLRDRIEQLMKRGPFERVSARGGSRWRFTGTN